MNKLFITGNATKDPELRTTTTGKNVCTFTLAANRRKKVQGQPEADFFRISAWDELGDLCAKYISKGKKIAVVGSVSVHPYINAKGEAAANMEVLAKEVEFLSPKQEEAVKEEAGSKTYYVQVEPDDLPY